MLEQVYNLAWRWWEIINARLNTPVGNYCDTRQRNYGFASSHLRNKVRNKLGCNLPSLNGTLNIALGTQTAH